MFTEWNCSEGIGRSSIDFGFVLGFRNGLHPVPDPQTNLAVWDLPLRNVSVLPAQKVEGSWIREFIFWGFVHVFSHQNREAIGVCKSIV